ncbi:MAG: VWA domain-containing protein [Candidatus Ancillula sp.]|jgi:hypothetical protein|nr:VWA domain-containing protein [Candidatus Ancillula sp.]
MSKKLGFVQMLDVSGSMYGALPQVKIDAKSFVREGRPGDQFGVNAFSDDAWWVYPTTNIPNIVTITDSCEETSDAANKIETQTIHNMTNIADALNKATQMLHTANTELKAYVLFSDGNSNWGNPPENEIDSNIPIFIAGLGSLNRTQFDLMTAKNPKSKFYNQPNAYQVGLMFNHIVADSNEVNLIVNKLEKDKSGSNYFIKDAVISGTDTEPQLSVVWSNEKYSYTSGYPSTNSIRVTLIDPFDNDTDIKPTITDGGYCIFNTSGLLPGTWKVLVEFSSAEALDFTVGGVEYNSGITSSITAVDTDDNSNFDIAVNTKINGEEVQDLQISGESTSIHYLDQQDDLDNNVEVARNDVKFTKRQLLSVPKKNILRLKNELKTDNNSNVQFSSHSVSVKISGINPNTGLPFTDIKSIVI